MYNKSVGNPNVITNKTIYLFYLSFISVEHLNDSYISRTHKMFYNILLRHLCVLYVSVKKKSVQITLFT